MVKSGKTRRTVGSFLLAAGVVIILGVAGYFGWTQIQAAGLRAQLRQAPTPAELAAIATEPTVTAAPAVSPTAPPPTPAPSPTATTALPSPLPEPAATAQPGVSQPVASVAPPTTTPQPPAPTTAPVVAAAAPVRLLMPDLKIDAQVVPMGWEVVQTNDGPRSEWVVPKNEAGHHIDSVVLGEQGNLVISGHNNVYGKIFRPISFAWDDDQRIKVDDYTDRSEILNGRQVQLFDEAGNLYTYVITEFYRLKDTGVSLEQRIANGRFMGPTDDTRLTLITCWPPNNNTHRLIVIATPVR